MACKRRLPFEPMQWFHSGQRIKTTQQHVYYALFILNYDTGLTNVSKGIQESN